MPTLAIPDLVCNAAAVFAGPYGAVTRRAAQLGCSRQAVYDQARWVERCLRPPAPALEPATPAAALDEPTRRRLAVTAFAMGISTRQVEELLRVVLGDQAPDHSTIGRWVAEGGERAAAVLPVLDRACAPAIRTLAVDEVFFGGDRPWSASSPPA